MSVNNMYGLSKIAPSFELCKKIPEGEFADSALVYVQYESGDIIVMPRTVAVLLKEKNIPAPTVDEIIGNFPEELKYLPLSIERNYYVDVAGKPCLGVPFDPIRDKLVDCVMKVYLNYFWFNEQERIHTEMWYADWMKSHPRKPRKKERQNDESSSQFEKASK